MIYNPDRFHQKVSFSSLPVLATDIDLVTDLAGKGLLMVEFKTEGTKLGYGQRKTYERLVQASGHSIPCFAVLAYHSTTVEEEITGDNTTVDTVWYRFPSQDRFYFYSYGDERPSLDEFICDLARALKFPASKLRKITEPWENWTVDIEAEDPATTPRRGLFLRLYEDGLISEDQVPWSTE